MITKQPLVETNNRLFTGPIDDVSEYDTNVACPNCGVPLTYIPAQAGACHSGLFWNSCEEHYSCAECERRFLEKDAMQDNINMSDDKIFDLASQE